jgi:hypothetical protein
MPAAGAEAILSASALRSSANAPPHSMVVAAAGVGAAGVGWSGPPQLQFAGAMEALAAVVAPAVAREAGAVVAARTNSLAVVFFPYGPRNSGPFFRPAIRTEVHQLDRARLPF